MSKTSSQVKDRYKKKAYDIITFYVKKGDKQMLKKKAEDLGFSSLSEFIKSRMYDEK